MLHAASLELIADALSAVAAGRTLVLGAVQRQAMATRIHAYIMSLIDGRRSLKDMARMLAEQKLMTVEEAEPALRSFLIKMYEDSRRQNAY